jgi:phosphopantetheine adenylyltransferase
LGRNAAAAIYLGHLNPMTKAHEDVISSLQKEYNLYVFPVRFLKGNTEINTRSFPFPYKIRKAMIEAVLNSEDNVKILSDYTFLSPFIKYLPPIVSPYSWTLRNQIVKNIQEESFIAYTGDRIERLALKVYRLHPIKAKRLKISSSAVKNMLYHQVIQGSAELGRQGKAHWQDKVPEKVVDLIIDNWEIIEKFAKSPDLTFKTMGIKFPKDGFI